MERVKGEIMRRVVEEADLSKASEDEIAAWDLYAAGALADVSWMAEPGDEYKAAVCAARRADHLLDERRKRFAPR
jgi:hypothetical protein